MINGKIKEWHMDPALLERLAGGGSLDLSAALRDYLKKTDTIYAEQLDPDILDAIEDEIQAVQDKVDSCRKNTILITLEDIDQEFSNLLVRLQEATSQSGAAIDEEQLQVLVSEAVAAQLDNSVSDTLDHVLNDRVSTTVDNKFTELITGTSDQRLHSLINISVSQAITNAPQIQELQTEILSSVANDYATQDQLQNAVDIHNMSQEVIDNRFSDVQEAIESFRAETEETYRKVEDPILESDLETSLRNNIVQAIETTQELSSRNLMDRVYGSKGQFAVFGDNNTMYGDNLFMDTELVKNAEALEDAKTKLTSNIVDISSGKVYSINRSLWKTGYVQTNETENAYAVFTVTLENLITNGIVLTEENGQIQGTNESETDNATVTLGFYGTRCKLFMEWAEDELVPIADEEPFTPESSGEEEPTDPFVSGEEEPTDSSTSGEEEPVESSTSEGEEPIEPSTPEEETDTGITQTYIIRIDNGDPVEKTQSSVTEESKPCFYCIEFLSEGPHRIDFEIAPGAAFRLCTEVQLDNEHAAIMAPEHIKPAEFYNGILYDTGDYVTEPEYDTIKSDKVSIVTPNEYIEEELDMEIYNQKFIYSTYDRALYLCLHNQFFLLSSI